MARRLMDPILGPDGKRLYVVTQEHIGAEEINAACEWTQRVHKALRREHGEDGMHNRGFQPIGAIRFLMPRWRSGEVLPGRVYPETFVDGVSARDHPDAFWVTPGSQGTFTIAWDPSVLLLPTLDYFVTVGSQPQKIISGRRFFRFLPSSRALNGFSLLARGSPATFAAQGHDRIPMVAVIYGAPR